METEKRVTLAIVGAGSRGLETFGRYILKNPDQAKVVAVAEPREAFRNKAMHDHALPAEKVFARWEDLLAQPRLADAVVIATTDRLHAAPAILAAQKGYHILLEKPMAPTAAECVRIVQAVNQNRVILAVCHVLRYATYYKKIKELIDAGTLGQLSTIQHLEGVAWWHYAHSYIRGNFSNEARSSFMLLAKSCHDIDILRWWIGRPCRGVASVGHLKHFRPENKPPEAALRCLDCPLAETRCPYSASRFYGRRLAEGRHEWPLAMVTTEFTPPALERALREGPYGRCVYQCDNDVVDHQNVIMDFDDDITADFTMTTFTPPGRRTRIMGSNGYLEGQEQVIRLLDFATEQWTEYEVSKLTGDLVDGHGGGDGELMRTFIHAVQRNDPASIPTGPDETLESHLIAFAAERARREKRYICLAELYRDSARH